jgi:hypothetical protein
MTGGCIVSFIGFVFFSTLEALSLFYFLLVLFRFDIRSNILKFGVISVVLSLVSNSLQTESLQAISPLVQAALCILFVAFLLRVHIFHASTMVITGYVFYAMIQTAIAGITNHFNFAPRPYTVGAFILQAVSSILMFLFALTIYLKKGGFSFVDTNSRLKKKKLFVKQNKLFIVFLLAAIVIIFITNFLYIITPNPPYMLLTILLLVSLVGLVSLSIRKDEEQ